MASLTTIQCSLAAGELSPSLYGRTDLDKWHAGSSTCRNFFVNYRGGAVTRAGLAYVGTCKQPGTSPPPRDIPFQFSLDQGYVLEFGEVYLRIKSDGAYVVESTKVITNITQAASALFTSVAHGYSVGDWIFIQSVGGMTEFNGLTWIVHTTPDANHFTVTDLFGNVIDSTGFPAYTSGGTTARLYTVVAPYAAVDLPYLKYTQSADTMTLTCVNTETNTEYVPYSLVRHSNTNWVFTAESFVATIQPPTNLTVSAQSSDDLSTWYSYVVTAVDSVTGEESISSDSANVQNNDIALSAGTNTISWNSVNNADSYNIYSTTPSYGKEVAAGNLYGFIGTSLGTSFSDTNIVPDFTKVPPVHNDPFARGAITDVVPTAAGINYSQGTIGWSVTTGTGTGFDGEPIVTNGGLSGFVIKNKGKNYLPGDTIHFTDSGGGVAIGNFAFSANPADGDQIEFNGLILVFLELNKTTAARQVNIQSTLALTLQHLAAYLNSLTTLSITVAQYTSDATHLYITYKTAGTDGNAYTLDALTSPSTRSAATLTGGGVAGTGATATLTVGASTGTYPSVAAYFQQRRVYADSLNEPDTYWMSQPGLFTNMDSSIPVTDADAIVGTPWAQQVNGIQFLVPMPGGLVVLTGKGAWQVNGGSQEAITPSNQNAVPQAYNGSNNLVPPIVINDDILYVQSKGFVVRDLSYSFYTNIYTGTDLTVLSNHLFLDHQVLQWAWSEEPYKLLWALRSDGILLCLTYLKEQEVYAWTRHDTNGQFVSVCSVTEPPVDAVYTITKRFVQGAWRYYSERMNNRIWFNVEDSFCVDSGLAYPLTYPNATLTPASSLPATGVVFTASSGVFSAGNVGDVIRVGGGKATITAYTNSTHVTGTITEVITSTVPDDPNLQPVPALSGEWSISTPTTTVTGLNHLNGLEVAILADGGVVPNQTVTNNSITLQNAASVIVIGLPYTCQLQTLYIDHPGGETIQNKRKNITSVGIRLEQTRGLVVGADQPDSSTLQNNATVPWTDMQEIKERNAEVFAGTAVPLYTGDHFKNITSSWTVKGQIAFQQSYPLPASILAVIAYWITGDDG